MSGLGLSTSWEVPTFPYAPVDEPSLTAVPDAYLTKVQRGDLRTVEQPTRWIRGAVHDAAGQLVVSSQKYGGLHGSKVAMADPARAVPRGHVRRLNGTWLYGGHWVHPFGHFFTETVTTLWPGRDAGPEAFAGLVFHAHMGRTRPIEPWQSELLDLAGLGGLPVEIVEDEPLRVEHLLVPSRSVTVNGWAHPAARDLWGAMAAASEPVRTGRRVYVTRSPFNAARRAAGRPVRTTAARDAGLDDAFADAGFEVVAPESLPVRDQVRLAAEAGVLAGCAGTALHLSAFAPVGARVLEVGDSRSPDVRVPTQRVIDALLDHPSAYVPHALPTDEIGPALRRLLT